VTDQQSPSAPPQFVRVGSSSALISPGATVLTLCSSPTRCHSERRSLPEDRFISEGESAFAWSGGLPFAVFVKFRDMVYRVFRDILYS
jgi:hypothetical protein